MASFDNVSTAADGAGAHDQDRHDCHQHSAPPVIDARWLKTAAWARRLACVSLLMEALEGVVGVWQGMAAGSIALTGWALGGIPESLSAIMVIWRFSGDRALSHTAERRAQVGVAWSFWLGAPYIAAESLHHLIGRQHADDTALGLAITAFALLVTPLLGRAQRRFARELNSAATDGEAVQNYLCAIQAGAVLIGLLVTGWWPGGWWVDPVIGLVVAGMSAWQGVRSWRGHGCGC